MSRAIAAALALVGAIAAVSVAQAAAPRASLKLSADRGLPGKRIVVKGARFRPRARAAISFAGRRLRTFRATRNGAIGVAFRVPRRRPGVYTIRVWTGKRAARRRFRVRAAPAAAPGPQAQPPQAQPQPSAAPERPATVVAAGDIACRPGEPRTEGTPGTCHHGAVSDLLIGLQPDVVAPLGDLQYQSGLASEFAGSYAPTWGRFKSITRPVVGNHEYLSSADHTTATPYFDYFGASAGDPAKGYYSYELGGWTMVVLNSGDIAWTTRGPNAGTLPDDCFPVSCKAGQPQEQWLRELLGSLPSTSCVAAFVHHPRYSDGNATNSDNPELRDVYDALYDHGAELVLDGHVHAYERFPAMNADGVPDPLGVPQLTVGTGGHSRAAEPPVAGRRSLFYLPRAQGYGVLELKLFSARYEFRFVGEDGAVRDSGGAPCHAPPP